MLFRSVSDSQLINIVIVGLSEEFDKQASFIPMMRPPPTFAEVRSMLQLAAETQARKDSRPRMFHATAGSSSAPPASVPVLPTPTMQPPHGWRPIPNYRGKNPIYRPPRSTTTAPPPATAPSSSTAPAPPAPIPPAPSPGPLLHQAGALHMIRGQGWCRRGPCHGLPLLRWALHRHTLAPGCPACVLTPVPLDSLDQDLLLIDRKSVV